MMTGRLKRYRYAVAVLTCVTLITSAAAAPSDSPVADAAQRGDIEAVRSLLKEGADVNAAQGDGMTALHWAARAGDVELTSVLLYAGANVHATTRLGEMPAPMPMRARPRRDRRH
jgi:ankyrin repeat protein